MTSFTFVMAWLCAVLMVPLMLFIWALDTKKTRIKRYGSYGWTWSKIDGIYNVLKTNDIFYMRNGMALRCAYGSTNAVYLGVRYQENKN